MTAIALLAAPSSPIRARRVLRGDKNQCSGCGEFFNSSHAFGKHRAGDYGGADGAPSNRRCLTTDEMLVKGMAKNAADFWCSALMTVESGEAGRLKYRAKVNSSELETAGGAGLIPA